MFRYCTFSGYNLKEPYLRIIPRLQYYKREQMIPYLRTENLKHLTLFSNAIPLLCSLGISETGYLSDLTWSTAPDSLDTGPKSLDVFLLALFWPGMGAESTSSPCPPIVEGKKSLVWIGLKLHAFADIRKFQPVIHFVISWHIKVIPDCRYDLLWF